jgi:hypothetical protein
MAAMGEVDALMDGVTGCANPRCTRLVIVWGLVCCDGCRRNLADPEGTPLIHSSGCDGRQARYEAWQVHHQR